MIRFFDIMFSFLAILISLPILLPVMIILLLTGEHNIFYIQERMGKGGKTFGLLKFATMLKNSPNIGSGDITVRDDPRVLPVGKFLRKTKINELPQLFNIFFGHMSVVGPRPLTPKGFSLYSEEVQDIIKKVKPGLTGIGSIVFRDEETIMAESGLPYDKCYSEIIAPYKGELEKWFYMNRSIKNYLKLIISTALVVVDTSNRFYRNWFIDLPEEPEILKK